MARMARIPRQIRQIIFKWHLCVCVRIHRHFSSHISMRSANTPPNIIKYSHLKSLPIVSQPQPRVQSAQQKYEILTTVNLHNLYMFGCAAAGEASRHSHAALFAMQKVGSVVVAVAVVDDDIDKQTSTTVCVWVCRCARWRGAMQIFRALAQNDGMRVSIEVNIFSLETHFVVESSSSPSSSSSFPVRWWIAQHTHTYNSVCKRE